MAEDLKKAYRTVMDDHFPSRMEIRFYSDNDVESSTSLKYEKVTWVVDGVEKGLRYGENPGQEAALYRLVQGNLQIGDVKTILPGRGLVCDMELLQSGKHPGKINLTDVDNALNILRYLTHRPAAIIMKHNNPSGVALDDTLSGAYEKADMADRVAAFGGAVVFNRCMDLPTAEAVAANYAEVVAAPGYDEGTLDVLSGRKNLRVLEIARMDRLQEYAPDRFVDFKALLDGGMIVQTSFLPGVSSGADFLPALCNRKGKEYRVQREPTKRELDDMLFGWFVEAGVTSNSVIYVKDGVTVGIGTGEQDRVGVAKIARDKAYTKMEDALSWRRFKTPMNLLKESDKRKEIQEETNRCHGGLKGACMISDAFFPFRDGVEVGLNEGVSAVLQPGGSLNDYQSIEAVNEHDATMLFTGRRSFKH